MITSYTERWGEHDRKRAELARWAREQAAKHGKARHANRTGAAGQDETRHWMVMP